MNRFRVFVTATAIVNGLALVGASCSKLGITRDESVSRVSQVNQTKNSSSGSDAAAYKLMLEPDHLSSSQDQEVMVSGSVHVDESKISMIRVATSREKQSWVNYLPIQNGKFLGKIPLNGGKGAYDVAFSIQSPDGSQYIDLQKTTVDNPNNQVMIRPNRYPLYYLRGFTLSQPVLTMQEVKGSIRVVGKVSNMQFLDYIWIRATNLDKNGASSGDIQVKPQVSGEFSQEVKLDQGPGRYNIEIKAPIIKEHESDDQTLWPVADLEVRNQEE